LGETARIAHLLANGQAAVAIAQALSINELLSIGTHMKLLIRNLDRLTTADEIKALLEKFGSVQSCTLVIDPASNESKGFGFAEMPNPGEAKAAIKSLNNKTVGGNKIRVKKAEDKNA
jgi:RNA recognition motif-containing protein